MNIPINVGSFEEYWYDGSIANLVGFRFTNGDIQDILCEVFLNILQSNSMGVGSSE